MPAFPPLPAPLGAYAARVDVVFARANQRAGFRQHLTGPRLPAERNKARTALTNTEPVVGPRPWSRRGGWRSRAPIRPPPRIPAGTRLAGTGLVPVAILDCPERPANHPLLLYDSSCMLSTTYR